MIRGAAGWEGREGEKEPNGVEVSFRSGTVYIYLALNGRLDGILKMLIE